MPRGLLALAILALLATAIPVAAHGPPAKRDQDIRLLADHNDDCGGDEAGALSNCHGTHDLVGLDLTEAHDAALGDVVRLRLIVNGGQGQLKDVITLKAGGVAKTLELRTNDNQAFTGTGFEQVTSAPARNADGSRDGSRIVVEGTLKLSALGGAGTPISEVRVQAHAGSSRGDYMPGGYYNSLDADVANPPQGDGPTNFERTGGYTLQGPAAYTTTTFTVPAAIGVGDTSTIEVTVANALRNTAQLATLTVTSFDGLSASWDGADGPRQLDLPKGGAATARLQLHGDAPGAGTLTLEVRTDLGGRSVHQIPYEVTASPASRPATTPDLQGGEGAPGPAVTWTALAMMAAVVLRRRS